MFVENLRFVLVPMDTVSDSLVIFAEIADIQVPCVLFFRPFPSKIFVGQDG